MPPVDRNLARIAVYELLWVDEIDDAVAITEAVELARQLSTDDSPRFLNGVLGRIADFATR
jgi:N utilization substance protein B